jgi:hypothetical protein
MVALEAFYVLTMTFFKISLGIFFLRTVITQKQRRIVHGVLFIFVFWSAGYFFFALFQCGVPSGSRFWVNKVEDKCGSDALGLGLGYAHAVLTAGTDLIFVSLPIPTILNLNMKPREKCIIACIFGIATM